MSESLKRENRRATARRFWNCRSHDGHADHVRHHLCPGGGVQDAAAGGDDPGIAPAFSLQPLINRSKTVAYSFERGPQNFYRISAQIYPGVGRASLAVPPGAAFTGKEGKYG